MYSNAPVMWAVCIEDYHAAFIAKEWIRSSKATSNSQPTEALFTWGIKIQADANFPVSK